MTDDLLDTNLLSQKLTQSSSAGQMPIPFKFDEREDVSLVGSVFRQSNMIGSGIEKYNLGQRLKRYEAEPDYDYRNYVPDDLFEYRDRYVFTTSPGAADEISYQLRKELNDKSNMEGSPVSSFFLDLVVGNLDPSVLLPGGTIYRNAKKSVGFLKSAAAGSASAAIGAGFQESFLNPTQMTREIDESVYNVMGAALFGSVLGGIGGAFASGPIGKKAQQDIVNTLIDGSGLPRDGNLSSAKVKEFDDEYIAQSESLARMGRFVTKAAGKLFPMTRLMESPFNTAKLFVDNAYEHNMIKNKNTTEFGSQANPINVESKLKLEFGVIRKALTEYQEVFFKQAGVENGILKNVQSMVSKQGLKWGEYDVEVARALRNDGKHDNPSVVEGAKILREKIFDPLKDQAIGLGLLPKNVDVKTALAYFTRIYNTQKIKEMPENFRATVIPYLRQKNEELKQFQPIIKTFRDRIKKARGIANKAIKESKELEHLKTLKSGDKESIEAKLEKAQQEYDDYVNQKEVVLESRKEKNLDKLIELEQKINDLTKTLDDLNLKAEKDLAIEKNDFDSIMEKLAKKNPLGLLRRGKDVTKEKKKYNAAVKAIKDTLKKSSTPLQEKVTALKSDIKKLESTQSQVESKDAIIRKKEIQLKKERLTEYKKRLTDVTNRIAELESSQAKLSAKDAEAIAKSIEKELDDAVPHDLKDSDGQIRNVIDDEQIDAISRQILDNVLGRNEAKILNPMLGKFQTGGKAKPLNNRAFLIPDELIEEWTLNSASKVAELYSKAMIPTIELNKFARRVDSPLKRKAQQDRLMEKAYEIQDRFETMTPEEKAAAQIEIGELYKQAEELSIPTPNQVQGGILLDLKQELDQMKVGKTPEENAKLEKQYDKAVEDINATFELLQGVYGAGQNVMDSSMAKVAGNIKTWNYIRMMGFVMLSSLPDVGMHIMRHGPMAFMKEGFMPFIKGVASERMNQDFLKDMGLGIESLLGTRLKSYIDHESTTESVSVWGKGLDFMSDTFGSVSLMNSWQDMNQFIAGNMSISRTLRSVIEGADKADLERLNVLGISKESRDIIAEQWKTHGGKKDGSYYINIGDWGLDDPKVAKAYDEFRVSIIKEVDSTVVRPGLGDKPLLGNTQLGQLLFQFKSFMFAATTRVLASGLTRNDANFYMGVVSMLGLGALRYVITSKIRKPNEEVDTSFTKLSSEAIDASGLLGVFSEVYNIGNKTFGLTNIANRALGLELSEVSRYQSRGVVGALMGPTFGGIEDIIGVLSKSSKALASEDVNLTTKDAEKIMRLFPYQNLFYLYNLNRIVTKKTALGLGFEETD